MQGEHDESRRFTQILGRAIHIDWIVPRQLGVIFFPCYQTPLLYTTSDSGWELVSFGWWRQVFPASLVLKTQSNTLLFLWLQRLTWVKSGVWRLARLLSRRCSGTIRRNPFRVTLYLLTTD
jgi:hypothetical protein